MKAKILFIAVVVGSFIGISCSKNDKVDLDKITGSWYWDTTYPHEIMDVGVSLRFSDGGTYVKRTSGMDVSEDNVAEGKYVISIMGKPRVLTLYVGEKAEEQYYIKRLDSRQMLLEDTADGGVFRYLRDN